MKGAVRSPFLGSWICHRPSINHPGLPARLRSRIISSLPLAIGVYANLVKPNSAQTALDLLVLTVLERRGPLHGYGIATSIEELSQDALRVEEGSLYPALHRMEELAWIAAEWKMSETKRRARFYRITNAGRKQLASESERWASFSAGVSRVLRYA
jgi:PadR family transcriptional regulator PadR